MSSSIVTASRCCQEMLIEGQFLDNSIHHCFHHCLRPPRCTLSLVKRRDVLQLLFLAKAASHKLSCNYPLLVISIISVTLVTCGLGPAHLNFLWQVKPIHVYRPLLYILLLFCRRAFLRFPRRASRPHPRPDRCWADIRPAVFCFHVRRVSRLISRQSLAVRNSVCGNVSVCALGIISALPAAAPTCAANWLCPCSAEKDR